MHRHTLSALPGNASPDLAHLHAAIEPPTPAAGGSPLRLRCDDGVELAAHWYEPPQAGTARAVAVISAAAGVPQGFYRAFASWLAQRGYAVLTFDYRGIGPSRRGPITAEMATMREWGQQDMSAALAAAQRRRATAAGTRLPLLWIGHSFGGNGIGLARGIGEVDAVLTVASQLGDWRLWPGVHRWVTAFFFHLLLPTVTHLFGHAPGWALGGLSAMPLPKQVALEWARWGRSRGFLWGDPTLAGELTLHEFDGHAHLWNVSDDLSYAPPQAVDGLATMFVNAVVQRHALTPTSVGLKRIGHFSAFRRDSGARIWPRLLAPIEAASPPLRAAGLAPL
jgi:predicted alpha/beta hydrolase